MKFFATATFLFIKFTFFPNVNLIMWMLIAIGLDFITGFAKACFKNENRTSQAMRKTIIKFLQYAGALAAAMIIGNTAKDNKIEGLQSVMQWANDGLVIFIIYIELVSIFENLLAIDDGSIISKYFFKPIHKLLTLSLKNNPVNKAGAGTAMIVMIIAMSGCSSGRHVQLIPETSTYVRDSTVITTDTIYRSDTMIIPGEQLTAYIQIPCPEAKNLHIGKKQGRTELSVLSDNRGNMYVSCKADSLQHIVDSIKEVVTKVHKFHEEKKTVTFTKTDYITKYRVPKWCWLLLLINVFVMAWKFKSPILSFLKTNK
jgi:Bacteriophage holin family